MSNSAGKNLNDSLDDGILLVTKILLWLLSPLIFIVALAAFDPSPVVTTIVTYAFCFYFFWIPFKGLYKLFSPESSKGAFFWFLLLIILGAAFNIIKALGVSDELAAGLLWGVIAVYFLVKWYF